MRTSTWPRRLLLEGWAIAVLGGVVGFLGPFGTWHDEPFVSRAILWACLIGGAWLLVRPAMLGLAAMARATGLPAGPVVLSGVALLSMPVAMIWRAIGQNAFRALDGYAPLIPFSLLCVLLVFAIAAWAERSDARLRANRAVDSSEPTIRPDLPLQSAPDFPPTLYRRLAPGFHGPVVALQSEDHYVRVLGVAGSELLLMRLRDAIAELNGVPGEQVHRSWWVAREAVTRLERTGRSWSLHLSNGEIAPVARESIERLQASGFLPAD